ncbi:hypothetical protein [Streptomyces sp. AM6-12]|uniref:hypothetical protein n=1 Tax=Streptomyces sp. AM6-12 TaxID=3345149 RepID=UPI0037AB0945
MRGRRGSTRPATGTVQLATPEVIGRVQGPDLHLGQPLRIRLVQAASDRAKPLVRPV